MANTINIVIQAKDNASAVLSTTAQSLQNTADKMTSVGRTATVGLTAPIVAAGVASLKMAGNFEQSLNVLQSVSSATSSQMRQLRDEATALGNDISLPGVSAKDAAQAMTELAKAGLSVNDIMSASKGVLSLAKAGNIEVADAAITAARALNAFQLSGDQANAVADLLAAGANASTASVQDMALGLQMAGAQSHQMGVSLQDTVTALSLFSNAGINGSDAGTSLKQMFIQLASPTQEAADLMTNLGLDFFDAQGNFIGLEKTGQQLQDRLKDLTVEQRNAALATIFGSDATRVASILAQQGAEGFDKMSTAVNKSGAAVDLAKAQNQGFNGALDNLKSTAETTFTQLGTKLLPTVTQGLKDAARAVSAVTDWFEKLSPTQQRVLGDLILILAAGGPLLIGLAKVITAVQVIGTAFTTMAAVSGGAISAVSGGVTALRLLVATPMVMSGIAVAGALADIALVMTAIDRVRGAIDAINQAKASADNAARQKEQALSTINNLIKNGTPQQQLNARKALNTLDPYNTVNGFASGTSYAPGGMALVGENGPELVNLPQGSKVTPARQTAQQLGAGRGVTIENLNVASDMDLRRVMRGIGFALV